MAADEVLSDDEVAALAEFGGYDVATIRAIEHVVIGAALSKAAEQAVEPDGELGPEEQVDAATLIAQELRKLWSREPQIATAGETADQILGLLRSTDPHVVSEALGWDHLGVEGVPWRVVRPLLNPGDEPHPGSAVIVTDGVRCAFDADAMSLEYDPLEVIPGTGRPFFAPPRPAAQSTA